MSVINCWAQSCTDGFAGTWDSPSDYNISEVAADAPGANSQNSAVIAFVNEGADDFHLDAGDTVAEGNGTDLSADAAYPISSDIDSETMSGDFNVGPDWTAAAGGGGSIPIFYNHYRNLMNA